MNEAQSEAMEPWFKQFQDYRNSGLTMKEWCDASGVAFNQLKYWQRKHSLMIRKQAPVNWVDLSPTPSHSQEASPLVLRIGNVSIDIQPGFSPSLLGQVVQALAVHA